MKRFCVKCGKETNQLINSLCKKCFLEKNKLIDLPKKIIIDVDKRTGRLRLGAAWIDESDAVLEKFIEDKVKKLIKQKIDFDNLKVQILREDSVIARVSLDALVDNVKLGLVEDIELSFRRTLSDASMKLSSNYHEAIIQVRFLEKTNKKIEQEKVEEVLAFLKEHKKKIELSAAVDIKNQVGGQDIFVGSNKAAKIVATKLARKYNTKIIYSNKLLGEDKHGKTNYRHTYCIRFPS
ncbi:MAG: 60S ribosomal export protein NMD3 [archaeon]|nr:60S ribosomal export protein NMD3 [archaeon]